MTTKSPSAGRTSKNTRSYLSTALQRDRDESQAALLRSDGEKGVEAFQNFSKAVSVFNTSFGSCSSRKGRAKTYRL